MTKECKFCDTEKKVSEFNKNKSMEDGLQIQCRECQVRFNARHNANRMMYARSKYPVQADIGVYCFKKGDEIVYIGSSDNLPFRIYKHYQLNNTFDDGLSKLEREFTYSWHVMWHGDKLEDAIHNEKVLIQIHQPKFNKIKYINYAA